MFEKIKTFLVGKPLRNEAIQGEKLGVLWGLPILSSDAISSVAYAGQEMLAVMLPVIGVLAYSQLTLLSGAIVFLLFLLVFSYRQTIDNYPNGGGAYIVSKDNLGIIPGVAAGAALSVDYVLTVAVSVSSGVEQIASAFSVLKPFSVEISVFLVLLLMIGNLRGISESSKIFGIPAYLFIFALGSMIVVGFYRLSTGYVPTAPELVKTAEPLTMLLLLKAFSSGCTALTGVEAVSNSVPNFKKPSTKYAKLVLLLLSIIILFLFGGTSILANSYKVVPGENGAMIVLMAEQVFGHNFMYFFITAITFTILILAANTAYSGFPMLISVMSKEGYAPRQLSMRGDKLAYDNGIIALSIAAILLLIGFNAKVSGLIGLYAIGVFISFTLSQTGMFVRWLKHKGKHWQLKAFINGFGAVVTFIVVIIIAFAKFSDGAWIVVILIPILIFLMLETKKHYVAVKNQLKLTDEEYNCFHTEFKTYQNHVIVPIQSINKASVRALKYAFTIEDKHITAFTVAISDEDEEHVREKYKLLDIDIPLKVVRSPYRKIVEPLLDFIESKEYDYKKGDMVTVILPKFKVKKWWHGIMHNNTSYFIEKELLKHKHIVVSVMPLQLKDDNLYAKIDLK